MLKPTSEIVYLPEHTTRAKSAMIARMEALNRGDGALICMIASRIRAEQDASEPRGEELSAEQVRIFERMRILLNDEE